MARFTQGGPITFPDATIQTTAYAPVEGSWTLAPGANTVSFTVDWNFTYAMWVRGNIPNGISVWISCNCYKCKCSSSWKSLRMELC